MVESMLNQELDLWIVPSDDPKILATLDELQKALLPHEIERYQHIIAESAKREYLITRVFLRRVLSDYYPQIATNEWYFKTNEHGRPQIDNPINSKLDFNISHTKGLIVILIRKDNDYLFGVDVEQKGRARRLLDIAERFFSPQEAADLKTLPRDDQPQRFIEYWTLKEAYIKAKGMGLALPLDHFSFDLKNMASIDILFDAKLNDDPNRWWFQCAPYQESFQLALAIERFAQYDPIINQRDGRSFLLSE